MICSLQLALFTNMTLGNGLKLLLGSSSERLVVFSSMPLRCCLCWSSVGFEHCCLASVRNKENCITYPVQLYLNCIHQVVLHLVRLRFY